MTETPRARSILNAMNQPSVVEISAERLPELAGAYGLRPAKIRQASANFVARCGEGGETGSAHWRH